MGIGADALTRLSDVLARRPELAKEKINLIWSQCPQQELLKHQSESRLNAGQLSGILAMARYLAHCGPAQRKLDLLQPVLEFIEALPKVAKVEVAWPPSFEASEFFLKLTEYLVMIAESWPLASTNVGKAVAKFILTFGVLDNEGVHIFNSLEIKAFLSSLTQNWPPLDHSKSEEVVQCLLEHWIMPQGGVLASLSSAESSCYGSPLTGNERDRKDSEPGLEGLIENMSIREESPLSTPRRTHFIDSVGTPSRSPEREGVDHASNTRTLSNVSGNGTIDRFVTTNGWTNALSGSAPYQLILDSEGLDGLKRQDIAFRLLIHILNGLERTGMKLKETHMWQLKEAATQQLKALLPILKMRKRDLTEVGVQMKAKMNLKLEVCQVAAVIETKCLLGSGDKGKIPKGLQETLTLLMDAAFACISSPWRRLKACECLFDALLSGVAEISVVHGRQILGVVLYRLKHLILSACAYADTYGTNQGAMFKSVVKGSCSIIKAGWNWDRSTIEPFLLSLAAHIRDRTEDEKEKQTAIAMRQLNVIPLLADLATMLNKCEAIEMVMPVFLESLQEGDASVPCLLRLRLLDAVARMATLGFEKSYRETVVLLTRSYMEKLSTVGSTHSRTLAPEATTERVDTLPVAFQVIARGLCQPELRSDYRHKMLILCSDVGLVAEAKSGRSGADLLGPLLPAVAEICRDFDAACNTDPSLLKLFRNLWFYIVLFGLAPAIQKVQPSAKVAASMSSLGSVSVQAVAGPYKWSSQWAEAVQCITEATPPLVVSSVKWVEDELELNALHNPGSRRGSSNEKAAIGQRAALAAALGGRVEASSLNAISGVKATYLLAVAFLEVLRFIRNGGIMKSVNHKGEAKSALCCTLKYLETPNLMPIVSQCLTAIVHRAFDSAMSWLAEKSSSTGVGADEREAAISLHACFLIQHLTHQNEIVRETADALLSQLRNRFPQVLWNVRCLECLLHLVENNPKDLPSNDHGTFVSSRMLLQQRVREWMTYSLLLAPSTTQGLLQEEFRKRNTWKNTARTSELLSIFSDMRLDIAKGEALQSSQSTVIPAVIAAAAAAAGANPGLAEGGNMEVLSTSLISANISANMKSSYLGEIVGMKKLYLGLNKNGPKGSPGPWFNTSEDVSGEQLIKEDDLALNAILFDLQSLQQFVTASEKGQPVESSAFREACMHATALLLSDTGLNRDDPLESFLQLLRLLCWCPAYIFTPGAMETGILIWTWLLSAAPHLGCSILSELVDAWLWTVDTGHGLFAHGIKNSGPVAELRPHLTPGEPDCSTTKDIVEGITAHQLWLGFFLDRFEVVRHSSSEQLLLIGRMIQGSVKSLSHFSSHPAARGSFFTLMLLGLKYCSSQLQNGSLVGNVGAVLLEDRIYHASLTWFAVEPGWYEFEVNGAAQFESQTMALFVQQLLSGRLESISNVGAEQRSGFQENAQACVGILSGQSEGIQPSVGKSDSNNCGKEKRKQLLLMLCQHEADRLDTWANPLKELSLPRLRISADGWIEYAKIAWSVDPRIAFSLIARFPSVMPLKAEVTSLVQAHLTELSEIPEALPYFVTPKAVEENSLVLQLLPHWAPCSITRALEFLTPSYKGNTRVMAYVLRVLESYPPERVTFFMPQLVQALRYDEAGLVEGYLVVAAKRSNLFAHILIWQLQGEEPPPEDVSKELPAAKGNSLYDIVPKVKQRIIDSFTPEAYDYFVREFRFFDEITSISGKLFPLPKEERRAAIRKELEKIKVEGEDLYLPTAPNKLVCGIELDSGVPLQSAAKVPIMITFDVIDKEEDCNHPKLQACIFKVGDDCRQDVLALQVIALLRDIFKAVNLNLYLFPYGVLPTGYGRGIIEVVPNSRSRNQMGEMTDGGLYEIFQQEYGPVGSQSFEAARDNFIVSSAGYAVASLLLQPKDRHNGNLLFDSEGRLVHIDFGFILETSPGGNLRFESAHFKLSHEMTQLLDPSGIMKSDTWNRFVSLCVKGYLAARLHMDGIVNTVLLMKDSGLPCFGRGDPIGNLRKRFHPEMTEREAANFMIRTCADAYNKWTTTGYDLIQYLQQGIEK